MTYPVLRLAAGVILHRWAIAGMRSVALRNGLVEPSPLPPAPGSWPIAAEACAVLVATVLCGARYQGWPDACAAAARELEAA